MRLGDRSIIATAILLLIPPMTYAQDETSRSVAGGGISVPGWTGKIDAKEERAARR